MNKFRSVIAAAVLAALPLAAAGAAPDALRDAARKAVVTNPEVQASWHAFRAAADDQDVARAGYLPQVDAQASIGRETLRSSGQSTNTFTHRNLTLSLNQMVYDGFFTRSEVARMGYAKLARYYELIEISESAALEALRAYGDVLRYRELTRLAQENYVQHKQIYDQIAERAGAGVGRRVDLEQATGRLALAESNLLTEVSNLHDVSARYLRIVGEVPQGDLPRLATGTVLGQIPGTARDALKVALSGSPALNAAVENVRASQAQIDARRAAFQPRVDLRARQALDHNLDGFDGNSREGVVEVVLSYNLFRGGADQARLRQAGESLNQARDLREKACRDLRQTLSIAYNDVIRLQEQMRYLDQHQLSIEKAREAYRRQFDIGQRTLLDLLDSENEYFQARRAYANASYDQVIAQARALSGMGQLMGALGVAREDLPAAGDIGQDRSGIDPESVCPPDAPQPLEIDKAALLAEAMKAAGTPRRGN
jgi:adhesin transport system outer membrane protein